MGYRQARPSRLLTAGMTIERAGILAGVAMTLIVVVAWMMDFPYLLLLPLAGLMAWWAVSKLDLYLGCILLLVPLSVNLSEFGLTSIGWYMPTEPMLFALLLVLWGDWHQGNGLLGPSYVIP